jgi:hypothetical protein
MLRSDIPVALPCHLFIDYDDVLGVDCDQSPADVARFVVPSKCQVLLAGLVVTETCVGSSTTPVVVFDKRPTAGSDGSRGAADIANFVLATTAAGKVIYDEVAVGTVLNPGDEVIVELTVQAVGSGAGHFVPFLLVEYLPETQANLTDMVETA